MVPARLAKAMFLLPWGIFSPWFAPSEGVRLLWGSASNNVNSQSGIFAGE
jgi:hypothetical protein